ncbi:hypothetical protein AGABI2DRAFT_194954 [Agaricus bisporus var. bisporus H97]|uniref:hypothetical protein n=1 Tax=Agaricus bisporus var. bisporus (strain H97 / ATCC MYA-4626 / FGSC 10389) TaxID=936046 RepID=UPI00029F5B67|nr:hypothetical protein AGABI2DRAFT_194954 [Agaricus bisporus var. bisporus H97]EKV44091.1 hypothetical protein AGABI2DRAFT_194954 [Agaricus bisporus var. bisporus H97]
MTIPRIEGNLGEPSEVCTGFAELRILAYFNTRTLRQPDHSQTNVSFVSISSHNVICHQTRLPNSPDLGSI